MLKIAVTGNIGSGKSSLCKLFEVLGAPVFYADAEAKLILEKADIIKKISHYFGNDILNEQSKIDKKKLAKKVFNNADNLQWLNSVIHPEVHNTFKKWVQQKAKTYTYCVYEAALIYEANSQDQFDKIILVYAKEDTLLLRAMKRDGASKAQIQKRLEKQWNQEEKKKWADFIIENENKKLLIPQIIELDQLFSKKSLQ